MKMQLKTRNNYKYVVILMINNNHIIISDGRGVRRQVRACNENLLFG